MARPLDKPDLYPPDVEHLTPELQEQRKRAVIGTFLLAMGCGYLLHGVVDHDLDFFVLSIGLALLAGWARAPRYPMFAFGAIIAGFGLNDLVESVWDDAWFKLTLGALFVAAGFFAVYVRYPSRAKWAIVPAAIAGVVAVADFGVALIGLMPGSTVVVPLALISAGALLLFRERLPNRLVKIGLIFAIVVLVSAAASSIDELEGPSFGGHELVFSQALAEGRLAVKTTSGKVTVETGSAGSPVGVRATVDHRTRRRSISNIKQLPRSADIVLTVPPGTVLDITTTSGDIDLDVQGGELDVTTSSGKVDVVYGGPDPESFGNIDIKTMSGDVELDGADGVRDLGAELELTTSSGEIDVDGEDIDDDKTFTRPAKEGTDFTITVATMSGDIDVEGV